MPTNTARADRWFNRILGFCFAVALSGCWDIIHETLTQSLRADIPVTAYQPTAEDRQAAATLRYMVSSVNDLRDDVRHLREERKSE